MKYSVKFVFDRAHLEHGKPEKGLTKTIVVESGSAELARTEAFRELERQESTLREVTSIEVAESK